MKEEEKNLGRKVLAEDRFAAHLRYLRSGSFLDRIRDLATRAMDPKSQAEILARQMLQSTIRRPGRLSRVYIV